MQEKKRIIDSSEIPSGKGLAAEYLTERVSRGDKIVLTVLGIVILSSIICSYLFPIYK